MGSLACFRFFHGRLYWKPLLLCVLTLGATDLAAQELPAPTFRLSPGDLVQISVFAHDDLSGSYRIREDGSIALHLVGAIAVAGLTRDDFEAALRKQLGTVVQAPVSTTVNVTEWRPVAVLGGVASPGVYPFSSGIDVMRAVALAGGSSRLAADAPVSQAMRVSEEESRYQVLKGTLAGLLVEQSRLLTERTGGREVKIPPEVVQLVGQEQARRLQEEQTKLLSARAQILETRTKGEAERRELALKEAKSFGERRALSHRQAETVSADLASKQDLKDRGLMVTSRLLELNLNIDRFKSDELEAAAYEASALQNASNAASNALTLVKTREMEISERLSQIHLEIGQTRTALAGSSRFLVSFGGGAGLADVNSPPRYVVTRRINGVAKTFDAAPDSLLQPGDALEVLFADLGASGASATKTAEGSR